MIEPALLGLLLSTFRLATPLALAALGELVAERAGVLNIGIEGMMLAGAFAAFTLGGVSGSAAWGALAGGLAGVSMAALFAVFVLQRRADPIVCGAAINVLALGATGTLHRILLPPTAALPAVPRAAELLPGLNVFVALTAVLALAVALALARTRIGLELRAVGERAKAAHAQGVAVLRLRWGATLFGGACAGLAGASLVLWISSTFVEGLTSGRGFIALALVLFGGFRAGRILLGALLFGAASALQFHLQALGLEIPYSLLLMTPYLLTLLVLAVFAERVRPPADLARPFWGRE
ncbi:MAG: ABC transporter permease [Myxococcota bacterium]